MATGEVLSLMICSRVVFSTERSIEPPGTSVPSGAPAGVAGDPSIVVPAEQANVFISSPSPPVVPGVPGVPGVPVSAIPASVLPVTAATARVVVPVPLGLPVLSLAILGAVAVPREQVGVRQALRDEDTLGELHTLFISDWRLTRGPEGRVDGEAVVRQLLQQLQLLLLACLGLLHHGGEEPDVVGRPEDGLAGVVERPGSVLEWLSCSGLDRELSGKL